MPGTCGALQDLAERAGADADGRRGLVHDRRGEDDVHAFAGAYLQVGVERPGVAREVFPGTELQWVYEDRDDQLVRAGTGGPDQLGVPGMQRAHRHDDGSRISRC